MRVEVVVIGNELLDGGLADTNTARLGHLLRVHGLRIHRGQTVPDEPAVIVEALRHAGGRSDLVLVTGGLGPTEDDLTIAAAADFAGVSLVEDAPTLARIRERFEGRGLPLTPNNRKQASAPAGATILDNAVGTAPGVRLEVDGVTFFFFPGVPAELERLAADHLLPWLASAGGARPMHSVVLKTFGRMESQVATLLEPLPRDPRLHVAYRAHFPLIQVTLHVSEPDPGEAQRFMADLRSAARDLLGPIVFTEDPEESFSAAIGRLLRAAGQTVALAESCTGGLMAKLITDVPGSSGWFSEGAVTYANEAKVRCLGVPAALISDHGAVSEAVARAMAEGIRERAGADFGLSITGIAGPGGGSPDKPMGTVHFALASAARTVHKRRRLPFDRRRNRVAFAWAALDLLRRELIRKA